MGKAKLEVLGRETKYKYNGFTADVDTVDKKIYLKDTRAYSMSMFIHFKDIENLIAFLNILKERL